METKIRSMMLTNTSRNLAVKPELTAREKMDFGTATTTFVKPEIEVKSAINQRVNDFPHLNKQSRGTTQPGLKSNHLLLI